MIIIMIILKILKIMIMAMNVTIVVYHCYFITLILIVSIIIIIAGNITFVKIMFSFALASWLACSLASRKTSKVMNRVF